MTLLQRSLALILGVGALLAITWFSVFRHSSGFDHDHREWKAIVDSSMTYDAAVGYFDYPRLVADKKPLEAYVAKLVAVTQPQYDQFSRNEQLAFLVNAYNAFTVQQIVELYPLESIQQIEYEPGVDAWHKKRFTLLGKQVCLDDIENVWIRPVFKEPLIHFALVCASLGCPALRWYSASEFEAQALESAKVFVRDSRRNSWDGAAGKLMLSEIFDWFKDDFTEKYGSAAGFVADLITDTAADREKIRSGKAIVDFYPYDWSLNEKKK